jgi:hypothetical protein
VDGPGSGEDAMRVIGCSRSETVDGQVRDSPRKRRHGKALYTRALIKDLMLGN